MDHHFRFEDPQNREARMGSVHAAASEKMSGEAYELARGRASSRKHGGSDEQHPEYGDKSYKGAPIYWKYDETLHRPNWYFHDQYRNGRSCGIYLVDGKPTPDCGFAP